VAPGPQIALRQHLEPTSVTSVRLRDRGFIFAVCLAGVVAFCTLALDQSKAQQAPPASQQGTGNATAVENNGEDFTRPQTLIQLRDIYQTSPGSGATPGTTRTVTGDTVVLRSDLKIDLAPQWTLALRGDLPFATKNPITADNPGGEYVYGLGDADVQAALIKTLNERWAAGAGLRIIAPTGGDDLTSGKWQALPIVGARYMLPELSPGSFFTALVRYDVSFAGDPSARTISNLQLEPTLNIALLDRWFVTLFPSPDIRINYGSPITGQTGRLFLPADALVGRNVTKDIILSLELSVPMVNQYPVYNFKTVARLNLNF
jgi:hypothetical protein